MFQLLDRDRERESELSDKDVPASEYRPQCRMGTPLTRHDAVMDMMSAYDRYNDGIELPSVMDQILMTMMTTARSMGWVKRQKHLEELRPLNLGFDQEVLPDNCSAGTITLPPLNLGFDEGVAEKEVGYGGILPAAGTAALRPLNLGFDPAGTAGRVALPPLNLGFDTHAGAETMARDGGTWQAVGTEALRPLNLGFHQETRPINLGFDENVPANNPGGAAWPALHLGFDRPAGAQTMPPPPMQPLNLGFDENVLPTAWPVPRPLNLGFDEEHVPEGSAENQPLPAVDEDSTVPTTDVWTRAYVTIERAIDRLVALEQEQALEEHPASHLVRNQIHACRQMQALYRQFQLNRQVRHGMNRTLHCLRSIGPGHLTE